MRLLIALLTAIALPVNADDENRIPRSGFLDDAAYDRLELVDIANDEAARRWLGPKLNFANFQEVLIDPVTIYPEPETSEQVSVETLEAISAYSTTLLHDKVGAVLTLAEEPGPGVLRIRGALTGVSVTTEGMKPYEIVPVAAVFGGFKALTGKRDRDVWVFYEMRFEDSVSGELVGASYRSVRGEQLKGKKDQLELEHMKDSLDKVTDDGSDIMSQKMKVQ